MINTNNWIIGIGGSDMDDVVTYVVTGTVEQVKQHLVGLIQEERDTIESEASDTYEYGTEDVSELGDYNMSRKFYGYATYSDCHRDYTATLIDAITTL